MMRSATPSAVITKPSHAGTPESSRNQVSGDDCEHALAAFVHSQPSIFALLSPTCGLECASWRSRPARSLPLPTTTIQPFVNFLFGRSKHPDTNFEMHDWSVKEPFAQSDWKEKVRARIRASDLVIVICGEKTHKATGVDVELKIAQEEKKPYFLLAGYADKTCTRPASAKASDKLYKWSWDNLKNLVRGDR